MKNYFKVNRWQLTDVNLIKHAAKKIAIENRLPKPLQLEIVDYFQDDFVKNKFTIFVYSMALMKVP